MPEIDTTPAAPAEAEAPAVILTPQDATAEHIARGLSPEQAKAFRANRKEKKAKAAGKVEVPVAADKETIGQGDKETITFNVDEETPAAAAADETAAELSDDELAKLDEKARKRITEASKEAAKVRKRAQEAEAKLKEHEAKLAELTTKLTEAEQHGGDAAVRAAGLAGNAFWQFKDGHEVAAWGENSKKALAKIELLKEEIEAGRRDESDSVPHTLPSGVKIELTASDDKLYEGRATDAQEWFRYDDKVVKGRELAAEVIKKYEGTKGYKEARESYFKDASLPARLEELVAKASLFDVLESRRAVIEFPGTAGAATKAPSSKEASQHRKDPPSESRASTPRLAAVNDSGSDLKARYSFLKEKTRTAATEDERQRYHKELIKLGPQARPR